MRRRALFAAACAALVCGSCQPPWSVEGTVVGETLRAAAGGAVHAMVRGEATFRCPHGEKKTQTRLLNNGSFSFSGEGVSFPMTCELEVRAPGYVTYREDFTKSCEHPSPPSDCKRASLAIELAPPAPPPPPPPPPPPAPPPSRMDVPRHF